MWLKAVNDLGGRHILCDQAELAERLQCKLVLAQALPCGCVVEVAPGGLGCGGLDLNQRRLGYEPSELPCCCTPRYLE